VKIISELSATRYMAVKVIRSNIEIARQELRRVLLDYVQIRYRVSLRHKRYTANVRGHRSNVTVTGSKVKVAA